MILRENKRMKKEKKVEAEANGEDLKKKREVLREGFLIDAV